MNWGAISFDWNQVRSFLAAFEEGPLSSAARVPKTTQPTIGGQISELEARLGLTLVERSVRGPKLMESGRDLLDQVQAMGEVATLISMVAEDRSQEITGEVIVAATGLLSASLLPGLLASLREAAPGVGVRIVASSDMQNLTQREADIAIRHARPEQPVLIARHVGDSRASLYAATCYLDRMGGPKAQRDSAACDFVGNADPEQLMAPLHNMGIPVRADRFVMSSESGVVAWELAKKGYGVSVQPEVLGDSEPGMEKVLPELPSLEFPTWLVPHRELQTCRRIRIVFDLLARGTSDAVNNARR